MSAPTAPRTIAALDVPLADVLADLHATELAAGQFAAAHDTDPLDTLLYRLAPGHPAHLPDRAVMGGGA